MEGTQTEGPVEAVFHGKSALMPKKRTQASAEALQSEQKTTTCMYKQNSLVMHRRLVRGDLTSTL